MSLIKRIAKIVLFVSLLFTSFGVEAISRGDRFRIESLLRSDHYDEALIEIENIARGTENDSELLMLKGITFTYMPQYMDLAVEVLEEALKYADDYVEINEILFFKARALHRVEKFDESIELCDELLSERKKLDKESRRHVIAFRESCIESKNLVVNSKLNVDIIPLTQLNTTLSETAFVYSLHEDKISTIDKDKKNIVSTSITGNQIITEVPYFFSKEEESLESLSFDVNETICILTVKRGGTRLLYETVREGETWTVPTRIESISNGLYDDKTPHISADGKQLYFASNRPNGFGGFDLYQSTRNKNHSWNPPKNLGEKINTPSDELYPWIQYSTNVLFFSSNCEGSVGGFDIRFYNASSSDEKAQNVGYPVNSTADDFLYMENIKGNKALISSTRRGGLGNSDIYQIEYKKVKHDDYVMYSQEISSEFDLDSWKIQILVDGEDYIVVKPASDGKFYAIVPNNKEISHYEFGPKKKTIEKETVAIATPTKKTTKVKKEVVKTTPVVDKIPNEVDRTFHIFFEQKISNLTNYSKMVLRNISSLANSKENAVVVISDLAGTDFTEGENSPLVNERVQSIATFFEELGIDYKISSIDSSKPFVVSRYFFINCPYLKEGELLTKDYISNLETKEQRQKAMLLNRRVKIEIRVD